MTETSKRKSGNLGERAATVFLERSGYRILETNFRNPLGRQVGEIDIVAREEKTGEIVFVEVKTRDAAKYGNSLPEENITYAKLKKMARIASFYLKKNKMESLPYRFDAISVWLDSVKKSAKIKHIKYL